MSHPLVSRLTTQIPRVYEALEHLGRPVLLLLVRIIWGVQFAQAGWGKLGNIEGVTGFFASLGIPMPALNAWIASGTEFVGGSLLVLGLGSRLSAAPLAFTMCVALMTSDVAALQGLSLLEWDSLLESTPFPFLFAMVLILVLGPGPISLDHVIARRLRPPTA